MAVDLHVHSNASDGRHAPRELAAMARERGVRVFALTDHDTVSGVGEAVASGAQMGVRVIPGVELSTDLEDIEIHILGYHVDVGRPSFLRTLGMLREGRVRRVRGILDKLERLGIKVPLPYVLGLGQGGFVGRSQVFRAMVNLGYARPERRCGDFERYLGKQGLAYVEHFGLSPCEAVALVLSASGVPVLAHPGRICSDEVVDGLVDAGLAGIEAYYPSHAPDVTRRWLEYARRHGLVVTGGSDFHGILPDEPAGLGDVDVPDEVVDELDERWRHLAGS